jgi:hypothetical protein
MHRVDDAEVCGGRGRRRRDGRAGRRGEAAQHELPIEKGRVGRAVDVGTARDRLEHHPGSGGQSPLQIGEVMRLVCDLDAGQYDGFPFAVAFDDECAGVRDLDEASHRGLGAGGKTEEKNEQGEAVGHGCDRCGGRSDRRRETAGGGNAESVHHGACAGDSCPL